MEACVTSVAEAVHATRVGVHRLELCRDLHTGGLTPAPETVEAVREATVVPLFAMVRPRPGDFRMGPSEVTTMLREIVSLVESGVDGVVLGVLDSRTRVDTTALEELVSAAGGRPVTFHRAFDEVAEPLSAVEELVGRGVSRVLTSGGADTAWEGREVLASLVRAAGDRLEILAGGAVRGDHVRQLVDAVGLREVHARASAVPAVVAALR